MKGRPRCGPFAIRAFHQRKKPRFLPAANMRRRFILLQSFRYFFAWRETVAAAGVYN
jgi:hypothetical protein